MILICYSLLRFLIRYAVHIHSSRKHGLQFSRTKGCLCIIIASNMLTFDKDIRNGSLARHLHQCALNKGSIVHLIQFVDGNVRVGEFGGKELFGLSTKGTIRLGPRQAVSDANV